MLLSLSTGRERNNHHRTHTHTKQQGPRETKWKSSRLRNPTTGDSRRSTRTTAGLAPPATTTASASSGSSADSRTTGCRSTLRRTSTCDRPGRGFSRRILTAETSPRTRPASGSSPPPLPGSFSSEKPFALPGPRDRQAQYLESPPGIWGFEECEGEVHHYSFLSPPIDAIF